MRWLPIRARLTAAFTLATLLMVASAGVLVYVRLRSDLDDALNDALRVRAQAFVQGRSSGTGDSDEGFAQLLFGTRGVRFAGRPRVIALTADEARRAAAGRVLVDRQVPGIEASARVLALPVRGRPGVSAVVVGQSLQDRDEALSGVVSSFATGGLVVVAVGSLVGFGLASLGFRPVEAMRRRATQISIRDTAERLPLPRARDEIRRLGETLNAMLDRLAKAFEHERRFVADASHELRTPIAVLKTELEAALRIGDHGPETREALLVAIDECEHLAQLAEDLLVLAQAAEGALPVHRQRVRIASALDDVRTRTHTRAVAQGRCIAVDASPGIEVEADPIRLRQALANLVDNALRHGGGSVTLRARRVGAEVELDVSDEGPGFSPELRGRAFERFSRADGARETRGAGLGLAIVQAIAEAHGGAVTILPEAPTTVRISLPNL